MALITYTAKRSLISGHTTGEEYTIELPLSDWTPSSEPVTEKADALSGKRFTTLSRIEKSWSAASIPTDDAAILSQMEEFLDSVAGGEVFIINPFGGQDYTCEIDGKPKWSLVNSVGFYAISFTARKHV